MKAVSVLFLASCLCSAANAAAFFGTITVDGRLPGRSMDIDLICRGAKVQTAKVDENGAYRFIGLQSNTGCEVTVERASAPVVLYPNPTRFDFALTHGPGGAALRQR